MNSDPRGKAVLSAFWPMVLPGLALSLFLGWQTALSLRQYLALIRLEEQQNALSAEAMRTEVRLKEMMVDVLNLAKTDEDSRNIVLKYNIRYTPGPNEEPSPDLQPLIEKTTELAQPVQASGVKSPTNSAAAHPKP